MDVAALLDSTHADLDLPSWANRPCDPPPNLHDITQKAIDVYLLSKLPNGGIRGIGWWQQANGYTAIALHDKWAGSEQNYDVISKALRECERHMSKLVNEFNDDTLWAALCCLHVYNLGGDQWFLHQARSVWKYVQDKAFCRRGQVKFLDQDMEGACYWTSKPDEEQVNSITTGLFAELGARLALLEQHSQSISHRLGKLLRQTQPSAGEYIEAARCSLGWVLRCRYRSEEAIVLDNILLKKQRARDWTFTYTTGVAIGVCALLYEATREVDYLVLACNMAHKAMRRRSWVEDNGVLTEPGAYGKGNHEPWQNNDAVGFKAVLLRHLAALYDVIIRTECTDPKIMDTAMLIKKFVNVNFESQQKRNSRGNGQYGPWWNGPFEMSTSHSQMAVLDVMAAVRLVNRAEIPQERCCGDGVAGL